MTRAIPAVLAATALLAAGAPAAAHPGGGGGRGGGRGAIIVAVIPGRASPYTGAPAAINLVLADPAKDETGILAPGAAIGVRMARAQDAVVLTEGVNQDGVEIAPGTVMVHMSMLGAPARIWCSVRQMPEGHPHTTDCLGGDGVEGHMTAYWRGYLTNRQAPFSVIGLTRVRPVAAVAYRPAKPEELPSVEIGYRLCADEGDGAVIPYRFTSTLKTSKDEWSPSPNACPFGEWIDAADKTVEQVDHLKVRIEPGGRYRILEPLGVGPLAAVYPDQSLRLRAAPSPQLERVREAIGHRPLEPIGAAETPSAGVVEHGATVAVIPVQHGFTGVLKNDVRGPGMLTRPTLPAGQYVFGVPTRDSSDPTDLGSLTWCAPRLTAGPASSVATVCFSSDGVTHYWFPAGSSLMVTHFIHGPPFGQVGAVSVERKRIPFGAPMKLAFVFDHWISQPLGGGRYEIAAQFGAEIRIGGMMTPVGHIQVPLSSSGRFCMPLLGGVLAVSPVDRAGAPVRLPPPFLSNVTLDEYMGAIDDHRAQVAVLQPPAANGAIPLAGPVRIAGGGDACVPPPVIQPIPRGTDPLEAATTAPAAP